jgi:hypothetical protein
MQPHNVDAAIKAGTSARAPRKQEDKSIAYVKALQNAEGFHKKAFYVEMAVCLMFYTEHEDNSAATKKLLRPIYQRAGYDCESPRGDDYKTVQRRISIAADLFTYLGGIETFVDWTADVKNGIDSINEVALRLEKQKLDSIEAVRKLVNRTPAPRAKPANVVTHAAAAATPAPAPAAQEGGPTEAEKALSAEVAKGIEARQATGPAPVAPGSRRLEDTLPPERVLKTEHLTLAIPMEATKAELMKLATDILAFAATMQESAVAAPVAA